MMNKTYTSSAIRLEPVERKFETQRPILCDGCEKRAGAIGPMVFFCAPCEIVIRVSPGLGRVEYTLSQAAGMLGETSPDIETLKLKARESSALDPLDPSKY